MKKAVVASVVFGLMLSVFIIFWLGPVLLYYSNEDKFLSILKNRSNEYHLSAIEVSGKSYDSPEDVVLFETLLRQSKYVGTTTSNTGVVVVLRSRGFEKQVRASWLNNTDIQLIIVHYDDAERYCVHFESTDLDSQLYLFLRNEVSYTAKSKE